MRGSAVAMAELSLRGPLEHGVQRAQRARVRRPQEEGVWAMETQSMQVLGPQTPRSNLVSVGVIGFGCLSPFPASFLLSEVLAHKEHRLLGNQMADPALSIPSEVPFWVRACSQARPMCNGLVPVSSLGWGQTSSASLAHSHPVEKRVYQLHPLCV